MFIVYEFVLTAPWPLSILRKSSSKVSKRELNLSLSMVPAVASSPLGVLMTRYLLGDKLYVGTSTGNLHVYLVGEHPGELVLRTT